MAARLRDITITKDRNEDVFSSSFRSGLPIRIKLELDADEVTARALSTALGAYLEINPIAREYESRDFASVVAIPREVVLEDRPPGYSAPPFAVQMTKFAEEMMRVRDALAMKLPPAPWPNDDDQETLPPLPDDDGPPDAASDVDQRFAGLELGPIEEDAEGLRQKRAKR